MENNCIDKLFSSTIFWILMGLQAAGTGGFIVLAVTMDIKYIDEEKENPGTSFVAINALFGIPVACFCFLFAGAAFFNVFHKASSSSSSSSKKSFISSLPSLKNKKTSSPTLPPFMAQDMV